MSSPDPETLIFIESFNGKCRDECLNEHWFVSLYNSQAIMARYRWEYNNDRPHSSLGNRTPKEFSRSLMTVALPVSIPLGTGQEEQQGVDNKGKPAILMPGGLS